MKTDRSIRSHALLLIPSACLSQDEYENVRLAALIVVHQSGDFPALDKVRPLLDESSKALRQNAKGTLEVTKRWIEHDKDPGLRSDTRDPRLALSGKR
jgi:hypothetical protein